jgi:hypothetical protein
MRPVKPIRDLDDVDSGRTKETGHGGDLHAIGRAGRVLIGAEPALNSGRAGPLPYALNVTLDPASSVIVERLYDVLAELGVEEQDIVRHYGPCVTLLIVSDSVHPDDVGETLARRVRDFSSFAVAFGEPCVVAGGPPPTLGLRVAPIQQLLSLHNAICTTFSEQQVHLHYRPAHWQPHVKLANARGSRLEAVRLAATLASRWEPLAGQLEGLEVISYPPTQSIWKAPLR